MTKESQTLPHAVQRAIRALNPISLENNSLDQKIELIAFGALLLSIATPFFLQNINVWPNPEIPAELLRHGIKMGLSASGSIAGCLYVLRGMGRVR